MQIALESADQPDVRALIDALDAYQGALYPAESNYHLSVDALTRPNVLYEFADPALEAQSAGRKLLLRMGPGNAARVKMKLRDMRDRIAAKH